MQKRQPAGDIYRSQRQELQPRVAAGLGSTVSGRTEEGACCGGGRAWDGGQGMNQDRLKSVDACTTKTPFGTGDEQVTLRTPRTGSGRWPSLILEVSASETRPTTTTVGAVSTGSVTVSSGGGVQRSLRRLLPRTTQGPSPSAPVAVVFQTPLSGQLTPTAPTATLGIASALVPGGLRSSTPQILSGPTSPSVLPVLSVAAPGHPPARAGAQPVLVVTTAQASTGPQPPQMLVVTHPSGGQPPSSYTVPTYVVSQGGNGFGAGCDGSPVGCFPPVRQLLLERPPRPQVSPPRVTSMPSSISFQGSPTQQPQSTPSRGSPTQQPQSTPFRGSPTQQPQSPPSRGSPTQQPQSPPSRGSPTQQPQSPPFRGSPTQQPQSPPSRGSPTQQPQSPPFRGSPTQQPQSPPSRGSPTQQPQSENMHFGVSTPLHVAQSKGSPRLPPSQEVGRLQRMRRRSSPSYSDRPGSSLSPPLGLMRIFMDVLLGNLERSLGLPSPPLGPQWRPFPRTSTSGATGAAGPSEAASSSGVSHPSGATSSEVSGSSGAPGPLRAELEPSEVVAGRSGAMATSSKESTPSPSGCGSPCSSAYAVAPDSRSADSPREVDRPVAFLKRKLRRSWGEEEDGKSGSDSDGSSNKPTWKHKKFRRGSPRNDDDGSQGGASDV
ncbi:hypothetical protein TGME49_294970 [Toxoplasma gondii ME49]|uniref:Uncharacterized protein n=8 Tax=Toxoplasma gondii TaxID=5811 RepID=A0A125YSB9_TOXGV|nr:hypothetical protein TGME49_294970 [Toxoplasma gondii ME49]EPR57737.1 hypothetical protein TGGT1_294970 [Toxoplasma gondii GT1]ESS29172.1 hypothetical protein TGVEG_294970 [Toxoplasma gondii VEG]KAF4646214.1 hypothetical protein TGRH88_020010 [Toxoplasma gondii]KFG37287.1 hypothetical protein TGDOM2_294970 [Toxoplasma gondii GAB2-2007-GAL-DOM2]KFG46583.1 hypothetical protein TGFOU_294970 [Toxoplasma gondii FOU]KFH14231.1 hypothetical protein TGMAS_294970 [Toxoplasma gondii MAS]RQX68911.1 |eukprot:XP_018638561.1 hypothetical protein TGME49_294970 [Toxoplasma gondii ME49]